VKRGKRTGNMLGKQEGDLSDLREVNTSERKKKKTLRPGKKKAASYANLRECVSYLRNSVASLRGGETLSRGFVSKDRPGQS